MHEPVERPFRDEPVHLREDPRADVRIREAEGDASHVGRDRLAVDARDPLRMLLHDLRGGVRGAEGDPESEPHPLAVRARRERRQAAGKALRVRQPVAET